MKAYRKYPSLKESVVLHWPITNTLWHMVRKQLLRRAPLTTSSVATSIRLQQHICLHRNHWQQCYILCLVLLVVSGTQCISKQIDTLTSPNCLWLTHSARDRERWVYILCYVLYILHRDRDREWGLMACIPISPFPVPFPVPCSVNEPLHVPTISPFLWVAPLIFLTLSVNSTIKLHWTHFKQCRKRQRWRFV